MAISTLLRVVRLDRIPRRRDPRGLCRSAARTMRTSPRARRLTAPARRSGSLGSNGARGPDPELQGLPSAAEVDAAGRRRRRRGRRGAAQPDRPRGLARRARDRPSAAPVRPRLRGRRQDRRRAARLGLRRRRSGGRRTARWRSAWPIGDAHAIEIPDGADPALAGALGIAGLAGWLPFAWRAPLEGGESVLVLGASGSVGIVAVQAAKLLGAGRVVAAGRSAAGPRAGRGARRGRHDPPRRARRPRHRVQGRVRRGRAELRLRPALGAARRQRPSRLPCRSRRS